MSLGRIYFTTVGVKGNAGVLITIVILNFDHKHKPLLYKKSLYSGKVIYSYIFLLFLVDYLWKNTTNVKYNSFFCIYKTRLI